MERPTSHPSVPRLILVAILIIGIVFFIAYEGYIWYCRYCRESETPLEFTAVKWDREPKNRHRMLSSLWHQYDGFEGMKQDEIRELLGEPSYTSTDSHDFYFVQSGKLLGPATFLSIRYDEAGIAIGFGLTEMD